MNCVFNKTTKKYTGEAFRIDIPSITADEVIIEYATIPDNTIRLNNTNDGTRIATQIELDADIAEVLDIEGDIELSFSSTQKAFALVVLDEINLLRTNAGLSTRTLTQLKTAVKSKL